MNIFINKRFLLFVFFTTFYFVGCSENTSYNDNAVEMTVTELEQTPSLNWVSGEINSYQADTNVINQIKTVFNPNIHYIYFYSNFTCGCANKVTDIAHFIKVLNLSGITNSNYKIFTMSQSSDKQPYSSYITVNTLPSAFILKDTTVVYSALDTLNHYKTFGILKPVEQLLLEAFKK
jgi:hypothetical protein